MYCSTGMTNTCLYDAYTDNHITSHLQTFRWKNSALEFLLIRPGCTCTIDVHIAYPSYPPNVLFKADKFIQHNYTLYLFRVIRKFTQFRNCTAQIKNCEIWNKLQNCAAKFTWFRNCLGKLEIAKLRSAISKVNVYSNISGPLTFLKSKNLHVGSLTLNTKA